MTMSVKDRDALLRVVKGRFELLETEVTLRSNALRRQIEEEVSKEHEAKMISYRKALSVLETKTQALIVEGRELAIAAEKDGLKLYDRHGSPVSAEVNMSVSIPNKDKIVLDRFEVIKAKGKLNGGLRDLELKITEKLITSTLETDEAKNFMAEIPSLDDVLPAAPELKALTK